MPPAGIRTRNPSKWAAADPRLRPRGHWNRRICISGVKTKETVSWNKEMSTPVNQHAEHKSPFRYVQVGSIITWLLSPVLELLHQIISLQYSNKSSQAISLYLAMSTCSLIESVVVREHFKYLPNMNLMYVCPCIVVYALDTICGNNTSTGLFKMIVGVLTTCHTQHTWDRSIRIFLFNRTTLQVLVTYIIGALWEFLDPSVQLHTPISSVSYKLHLR